MPHLSVEQAVAEALRLQQSGQLRQAEEIHRQVLAVDPNQTDALHLLGLILLQTSRPDEAVLLFERVVALNHSDHVGYSNLGNAQYQLGRDEQAIAAYQRALAIKSDSVMDQSNLSASLMRCGKIEEAVAAGRRAVELDPNFADGHLNLAAALSRTGEFDAAIAAYMRSLTLRNDSPLAHLNLGLALLRNGDYARGWEEYEWRKRIRGLFLFPNVLDRPQWLGQDLTGQTIFLHAEQGFGDTLQFIRYVPLVAQRGARIILGCHPELQQLFGRLGEVAQCVTPLDALPPFDWQSPLGSLPRIFQTRVETIPSDVPYLRADANPAFTLPPSSLLNIGLVWAGRASSRDDRARACSLDSFAPLAQISGIRFHSLQKGPPSDQAKAPPPGMQLMDWDSRLNNFADTAALIDKLDLLITIDSAAAHLAGAMSKPAFVLLPFVSDWRWKQQCDVSPWYPTLRLFRQPSAGDWIGVINRAADALNQFVSSR